MSPLVLLLLAGQWNAFASAPPWVASTYVSARAVPIEQAADFRVECITGPEGYALRSAAAYVEYQHPPYGIDTRGAYSGEQGTGLWVRLGENEVVVLPEGHDNRPSQTQTVVSGTGAGFPLRHPDQPAFLTVAVASWGGTLNCTLETGGQSITLTSEPLERAVYLNNERMPGGVGVRASRLVVAADRHYERHTTGLLFAVLHTFNGEVRMLDAEGVRRSGGRFAVVAEPTNGIWTYECIWAADVILGLQLFIMEL